MKSLLFNLAFLLVLSSGISCNSVKAKEEKSEILTSQAEKVEVYYFHYSRRCVTCTSVENETKAALEQYFSEELKNESVIFITINLDEPESETIAEKLEISGQTLLIVAGEKRENLTTNAFMNAKSNPEKLRGIIKSTIDPFISE